MRFLHLSDLHLGKRVCEFSMLDDQRYILEQALPAGCPDAVDGGSAGRRPLRQARAARRGGAAAGLVPHRACGAGTARFCRQRQPRLGRPHRLRRTAAGREPGVRQPGLCRTARAYHPDGRIRPGGRLAPALFEACRRAARLPGREDRELQRRHRLRAERLRTRPRPPATCWWPTSSWPGRRSARAKSPAWAGWTASTSPSSRASTMWLWATSTVPRRWDGTPSGTQAVPSNIPSPRPISTKPLSSSPWAKRAASGFEAVPLTPRHDLRELRGSYMDAHRPPGLRRHADGRLPPHHPHRRAGRPRRAGPAAGHLSRTSCGWTTTTAAPGPLRRPTPPPEAESKTPLEHFAAFYEAQNGQPLSDEQAAFCQSLIEDIWKEDEA